MLNRLECRRVSPLLWEHAEGALRETEALVVEQHLKRCPACAHALARLQAVQGGLSSYRSQEIPATRSTWHALRTQIESENQATAVVVQRRSYRAPLWAATAAAGAIAALIVVPMFSRNGNIGPIQRPVFEPGNPQVATNKSGHEDTQSNTGGTQGNQHSDPGVTHVVTPASDHGKLGDKNKLTKSKRDGGRIDPAIVRDRVQPKLRPLVKARKPDTWSNFKPNPNGRAQLVSNQSGVDGAMPSNHGREYVTPGIAAGRGSNIEYVMGTIGDSRARIIPASNTSEENSW